MSDPRWRELRGGLDPKQAEQNVEEELRAELEEVQRLREAARGAEKAREGAAREARALERRRRTRGARIVAGRMEGMMMEMMREIRIVLRGLFRAPGFSLIAVATLAIGIGANALIFGVVDSVVLRPLPYPESERLVELWDDSFMGLGDYALIAENTRTLEQTAAWRSGFGANLEWGGETLRATGSEVTASFHALLPRAPELGRAFSVTASDPGAEKEMMLGYGLWNSAFAGDPNVIGRTVRADGVAYTVVGVLSRTHDFPASTDQFLVPITIDPADEMALWSGGGFHALGRLGTGRTAADAQLELADIHDRVISPSNPFWTPPVGSRDESTVSSLHAAMVGAVRGRMMVLLAAVGLVILVVSANVANLLLSRGLSRRSDLAVRVAMGAGKLRLIRAGVMESLLLAIAGTAAGIVFASFGMDLLRPLLPPELPRAASISIDGRVIAVTAMLAGAIGVVTGLVASFRGVTHSPAQLLRSGGRGHAGGRHRTSRGLVFAQIAVSVVLVTTAGLLVRSLNALNGVEAGFQVEDLSLASIHLSPGTYATNQEQSFFFDELERRLSALPEVERVAIAGSVPFGPSSEWVATYIDGVTEDPNSLPVIDRYRVTPDYFETMGIERVAGRGFSSADGADGELVAIVDEAAQAEYWPEGAVGRVLRDPWRGAPAIRIVGVVRAVRDDRLSDGMEPSFYLPLAQRPAGAATIVLRPSSADGAALSSVRSVLREMDERVPVSYSGAYASLLSESMAETRLTALLLALFAATAVALGSIGLYGVAAYMVREQTREFGVRLALGAEPAAIRSSVFRAGLRLAIPGAILGLVLTIPAARFIEGLLYDVSTFDPLTFGAVPLLMAITAVLSVWVPARRVTRLDPAKVLRAE